MPSQERGMTSDTHGNLTYYDALGVSRGASLDAIRAAYRKALLQQHPDKVHGAGLSPSADKSAFLRLHTAWQVLKDAQLRSSYDKQLQSTGQKTGVFISNEVDLDDMQHGGSQNGSSTFSYPCRCGEAYVCAKENLTETADSLLVQCQGCSLVIKVLYTVTGDA